MTDAVGRSGELGDQLLLFASWAGIVMISVALVLASIRLFRGPSIPDRIVALELIASLFVGVVVLAGLIGGASAYLDVAIALTLVGFLGAIVFARFVERGVGR